MWISICGYVLERPTEPSRIDAQNPHRWRPGNRPLAMMSGSGEVVADSCGTVINLAENHTAHTLLKATFDLSWSPNSKTLQNMIKSIILKSNKLPKKNKNANIRGKFELQSPDCPPNIIHFFFFFLF